MVGGSNSNIEQLWVRKTDDDTLELCCIPFFLYDCHLGDRVEQLPDGALRVLQRGDQMTFRVWLGEAPERVAASVHNDLVRMGCLHEGRGRLLAISVSRGNAQQVADFLHELEVAGKISYETGVR
jgi:hypothetical protein